jgi:hypothetical protein
MCSNIGFLEGGVPFFVLNQIACNVGADVFPVTAYSSKESALQEMTRIHNWFLVRRGNKYGKSIALRLAHYLENEQVISTVRLADL